MRLQISVYTCEIRDWENIEPLDVFIGFKNINQRSALNPYIGSSLVQYKIPLNWLLKSKRKNTIKTNAHLLAVVKRNTESNQISPISITFYR